jgi:hypothetical protein
MLLALQQAKDRERMKNALDRKPEPGDQSLVDCRPNLRISHGNSISNTERGYGLALHDEGYKQKLWWTRKLRKEAPSMSQVCELGNAYEEIQRNDLQEQIPLTRLGRSVNTWFG